MSEPRDLPPQDADCRIGGSYFKIGLRGRPFRWNGEEWLLSAIDPEVIICAPPLGKSLPLVTPGERVEP